MDRGRFCWILLRHGRYLSVNPKPQILNPRVWVDAAAAGAWRLFSPAMGGDLRGEQQQQQLLLSIFLRGLTLQQDSSSSSKRPSLAAPAAAAAVSVCQEGLRCLFSPIETQLQRLLQQRRAAAAKEKRRAAAAAAAKHTKQETQETEGDNDDDNEEIEQDGDELNGTQEEGETREAKTEAMQPGKTAAASVFLSPFLSLSLSVSP